MSVSIDGTNGLTFSDATTQNTGGYTGFRNRIINGDMRIDQRNNGASVTNLSGTVYTVDRWFAGGNQASKFTVQQNAGSVTPPAGFTNYLGVTSSSAYTVGASEAFRVSQGIEGFNAADFGWGTANASTVTISFWVRSSLTGTFGGSVFNSAGNRSYPFSYTISSANTWEQKSITITGDTSGTWATNNTAGLYLNFSFGAGSTLSGTSGAWASAAYYSATGATSVVGTNGATFYITGVQLEKGSVATPFEFRAYGTELALCQRYYEKSFADGVTPTTATAFPGGFYVGLACQGAATTTGLIESSTRFMVSKRTPPTVTFYDHLNASGVVTRFNPNSSNNNGQGAGVVRQSESTFTITSISGAAASTIGYSWVATAEL